MTTEAAITAVVLGLGVALGVVLWAHYLSKLAARLEDRCEAGYDHPQSPFPGGSWTCPGCGKTITGADDD